MSMSKRLQVVMDEAELDTCRDAARRAGVSLSEWARAALRRALAASRGPSSEQRLKALEHALGRNHPTADIADVLAQIDEGRGLR